MEGALYDNHGNDFFGIASVLGCSQARPNAWVLYFK